MVRAHYDIVCFSTALIRGFYTWYRASLCYCMFPHSPDQGVLYMVQGHVIVCFSTALIRGLYTWYRASLCYCMFQDSPDQGVLYMVRGLLNVLTGYSWEPNSDSRVIVFMNVLNLLSAMSQENYLYHVDKGKEIDNLYIIFVRMKNVINWILFMN